MADKKMFNNVILGQFVLTGVPIKVYASGRFLTLTDTDDVESPIIGFGMDEDGEMIQFGYPEVEFISVQGNRVDIETYNKGMSALHGGEEAPAEAEEEEGAAEQPDAEDLKDGVIFEISKDELKASMDSMKAEMDAGKAKIKAAKDKMNDLKKQPIEDGYTTEHDDKGYTFGTGDVIQNTNPGCVHFGSKGIVISKNGNMIRYTVTNGNDKESYRPGDILTKTSDQLEVYN